MFRWIFLGSAYAYSADPDFAAVSTSQDFWQNIIDQFNEKYDGIASYHRDSVNEVLRTGKYVHPLTGRIYEHTLRERRGDWVYNPSEIVNFPVQGLGADMMALIRAEVFNRLQETNEYKIGDILPILTVHDSVMYDCKYSYTNHLTERVVPWYTISMIISDVFKDVKNIWFKHYGTELVVDQDCEIQVGVNWKYLHSFYKGGKFNFKLLQG